MGWLAGKKDGGMSFMTSKAVVHLETVGFSNGRLHPGRKNVDALGMALQLHGALHKLIHGDVTTSSGVFFCVVETNARMSVFFHARRLEIPETRLRR